MEDECVCCGEYVPEGRQVCWSCEHKSFEHHGKELGKLVDTKQKAYGDSITKTGKILHSFLADYDVGDGNYLIPKKLIDHLGLLVRIIDKQNRIISNPEGDLMGETPYKDIAGYGLLGSLLIGGEKE